MDPNFARKPLLCPKCQSPRMVIQEIYEMWETPQPKSAMPNFGASFKRRVLCADCGEPVWPEGAKAEIEEARQRIAVQNYVDSRLPEAGKKK